MDVILMFAPKRTREYSQSPFDFDHDFLVPRHDLVAVCGGNAAAAEVRHRIIQSLKDDCKTWLDMGYSSPMDNKSLWKHYMPTVWDRAIEATRMPILSNGLPGLLARPTSVNVVMSVATVTAWDGSTHEQLTPVGVHSSAGQTVQKISDALGRVQPAQKKFVTVTHDILRSDASEPVIPVG